MSDHRRIFRPCPCCGTRFGTLIYDNQMAPLGGIDMSYRVAECQACGLLYAQELPDGESYARYYQTLSKYDQIASIADIPPTDAIRAEATIAICAPHIRKDDGIADLGCGIGYLLHRFQNAGWHDLHGVDPAPTATDLAHRLFGLTTVHHGLLSDAPAYLPIERIGLVCLTGVLEHLWAPLSDLKRLFTALQPGTRVLIEVPALERFERPPCEPFGELSLEHIQYFSARSLENLMQAAGATPVSIHLLDLAPATTDSLLCLFQITPDHMPHTHTSCADGSLLRSYLDKSSRNLNNAISILSTTPGPWILYGAGSHTARLLPILTAQGLDQNILGIVDSNTNLHGHSLGHWQIAAPDLLNTHPDTTVVISSFRAQTIIHRTLASRYSNPLLCLYTKQEIS